MYRRPPSIGSKLNLWMAGWMFQVDVYLRDRITLRGGRENFNRHTGHLLVENESKILTD